MTQLIVRQDLTPENQDTTTSVVQGAQIEWGGVIARPAPGRSALNLLFTLKMLAIWSTYSLKL